MSDERHDVLVEVLRNELRRQAEECYGTSFTQWYTEYDTPSPVVNHSGDIHLADLADAVLKAIETHV